MEDFEKKIINDVVVEAVNLSRATWKEATAFKEILKDDIEKKFKRIIVDISQCEFMDSTFLGALVLGQKNITKIGGEIKIVEPVSVFQTLMEKTSTLKIFDTYKSLDEAVRSFSHNYVNKSEMPLPV
jgi:anti-sigma B factor antagonist/stage II sporulation protein AA (anti-sigma F factor antagonist)